MVREEDSGVVGTPKLSQLSTIGPCNITLTYTVRLQSAQGAKLQIKVSLASAVYNLRTFFLIGSFIFLKKCKIHEQTSDKSSQKQ